MDSSFLKLTLEANGFKCFGYLIRKEQKSTLKKTFNARTDDFQSF